MQEKRAQALLKPVIEEVLQGKCAALEYKVFSGKFAFGAWIKKQPHQLRNLLLVESTGFYHKINDSARGQKPFDAFILSTKLSYLVLVDVDEKMTYFIRASKLKPIIKTEKFLTKDLMQKLSEIIKPLT